MRWDLKHKDSESGSGLTEDELEARTLNLINEEREKQNNASIRKLEQIEQLRTLARIYVDDLLIIGEVEAGVTTWGSMTEFLNAFELRTNGGSISAAKGFSTYEELIASWKNEPQQYKKMVNPDYHHAAVGVNLRYNSLIVIYARLNAQASLQIIDTDQIPQGAYKFDIRWTSSEGNDSNQTYLTDDQGFATTLFMDYGTYAAYNMTGTKIGTVQINQLSIRSTQVIRIEKLCGSTFSVFVCERLSVPTASGSIVGRALKDMHVDFYPTSGAKAVCNIITGTSGVASCHGDNFQVEEQLTIVVWDEAAVYETFRNTLQFYGGKTRQTIPLGKQYVVSLTVSLEAPKACPESAEVCVYARREQQKVLLFGETGSSCVFTFENKNEANLLQINEVVTVSVKAVGYVPVDISLRIADTSSTLTIPLEL